jgi:beta-glucanase (GH16 family)
MNSQSDKLVLATLVLLIAAAQAQAADFTLGGRGWNRNYGGWQNNRSQMNNTASGYSNGVLYLTHTNSGGVLRGAAFQTEQAFRYGNYSAQIQAPAAQGLDAGFFMYNNSRFYPCVKSGCNYWNEIDFEFLGFRPNNVHTNIISGSANSADSNVNGRDWGLGFNFSQGFHTYEIRYSSGGISWVIDGRTHRSEGTKGVDAPMYLMANIWAPGIPGWNVGNQGAIPSYAQMQVKNVSIRPF